MLNKSLPINLGQGGMRSGGHIHRSISDASALQPASSPTRAGGLSGFLRRKKPSIDETPPPTPPKDTSQVPRSHVRGESDEQAYTAYHSANHSHDFNQVHGYTFGISRSRGNSLSEVVHITHDESDMVVIEPHRPTALELKWANEPFAITDPVERARRRQEARRQKEEEERRAVEEEVERQRLLKLKKQEILDQEIEEEEYRKISLEKRLRDATAERVRREREIKQQQAVRDLELAEKKKIDKEKRIEDVKRLEKSRVAEQRRNEEMIRRKEGDRVNQETTRKAQVKIVEAKIRKNSSAEMMVGWVTIQASDALTLTWRRRFFKFAGTTMYLYRSPKDTTQALDSVELRGRVKALREWHEGYEELESIPHSFALEFKVGQCYWSLFSDSEGEKVVLLSLLHQAAGLKL